METAERPALSRLLSAAQTYLLWPRSALVLVAGGVLITVGGKLLGLVRELLIASTYGTGEVANTFFAVYQLPVVVSSFMVGPFMLAYVPHYAALRDAGGERASLRRVVRLALVIGAAITGLMVMAAAVVHIANVGPPWTGSFMLILALSIIPLLIGGLSTVVLYARGQPLAAMTVAACGPAVMLFALALLLAVPGGGRELVLPWSATLGWLVSGVVGAAILIRIARRAPVSAVIVPQGPTLPAQLWASSAETLGFSLNHTLTVALATGLGAGSVAINAYAFRLILFALSSSLSPLHQAIHSWMAQSPGHREGRTVLAVIVAMAALTVALAATLAAFSEPVVAIVYERGAFAAASTARVAGILAPYALYFAVMGVNQLFARYFFVSGDGWLYARAMLAAYLVSNVAKAAVAANYGLAGMIIVAAAFEAIALAYFVSVVVRRELWR